MDERPAQPPEGKLIADALARSGMSIRKASLAAGISYGRWRQITSGFQNVSPGSWAAVRGPAATLARMARVVGVTAAELEKAGRADAAAALGELTEAGQDGPPADLPEVVRANWSDATVRQTWQNEDLAEKDRLQMVLFYLAVVKGTRERAGAEVTPLRKANGA